VGILALPLGFKVNDMAFLLYHLIHLPSCFL
jgi:hypothetical protein